MIKRKLHEDWPEFDLAERWISGPVGDLQEALETGQPRTASFPTVELADKISLAEVDRVVRYHVSYHGETWTPGDDVSGSYAGTELDMYVVGQLVDGHWFSVVAWNDYTGWGCQDGAEVRIGDTEEEVVDYGLDEAGRKMLDY